MPELMRGPEWPLLIALAVGLLIGADRERRKNEDRSHRPAGVRTFTLVAVLGGLAFAIAAAVVLPMIPNRPLDAFGLFNPYTLWRLVVVVMALSGIGYVAQRLVGIRYGLLAAGLATGLISATAGVAAMAHRS